MPNFYSPYQYPQQYGYQMPQPQQSAPMPQSIQQPTQPQMQNGGFMIAPNEDFVRNYPVGLGNCITFKIENKPYVMEKSMGFSQLDSPKIEKYKLVKETDASASETPDTPPQDNKVINDALDTMMAEIEAIKQDIKGIKEKLKSIKPATKKPIKDEDEDDE